MWLLVSIVTGQLVDRARLDVVAARDAVALELATGVPVDQLSINARVDGTQIRVRDERTGDVLAVSPVVQSELSTSENKQDIDVEVTSDPSAFPTETRLQSSTTVHSPGGPPLAVEAAKDDEFVDVTRSALYRAGIVVGMIGIALATLLAWLLAGRALQPVRAMTERAADIDDANRSARIPLPDTDDEIALLAQVLNRMLDRFEATRQREEALVSDVAHELRTPLSALHARLDSELERAQAERPGLEAARTQVHRLSRIVSGILETAQLESAGPATPERRPVDLAALVRATLIDYEDGAVSLTVDRADAWIDADPEVLTRVVMNLVDNALRHGGAIAHLTVSHNERCCTLRVDDDGPGIPADDRERVFDRFVRLDPSRRSQTGGAGLGLAIVRAAVHHHGGRVTISNGPNAGASVIVELPLVPPQP